MQKSAKHILDYLSTFQLKEGHLNDPDTKEPIKNSYGNAFYALAQVTLYLKTKDQTCKTKALQALDSELNWAKLYHTHPGIYRWEFKNYAIIQVYSILKSELSTKEKSEIEQYIKASQNICSYQTNYTAMRALNSITKYSLFKKTKDKIRAKAELQLVLFRQDQDGLFADDANHHSFQYHAYILALLYQYHQLSTNPKQQSKLQERFLKGVHFLIPFINQEGDFNYIGRGQRQIFGYASYIYALRAAAHLTSNSYYLSLSKKIEQFIEPYIRDFEIVCSPNQDKKVGYYPYNNRSDYLSFTAYYLLLANEIPLPQSNKVTIVFDDTKPLIKFYSQPNLLLIRNKDSLYILGGTPGNHAELPLILHTYPSIFTTSGGPSTSKNQQIRYSEAYTGFPSIQGTLTTRRNGDIIEMLHSTPKNLINYRILLSNKIELDIAITPRKPNTTSLFHLAIPHTQKSNINDIECSLPLHKVSETYTLDGTTNLYETHPQFLDKSIRFKVSFGNLVGTYYIPPISQKPFFKPFIDNCGKYPYFAAVLILKTIKNQKHAKIMLKYHQERKKYY